MRGGAALAGATGRTLGAAALLAAAHLGFLLLSRLLADPGIPFDARILAPAEVLAAFALGVSAALVWRRGRAPTRALVAAGVLAWSAAAFVTHAAALDWLRDEGSDLAGVQWRDSPLVAWSATAGAGRALYTNWPAALYFHAGRAARYLPDTLDAGTLADFDSTLARTHGAVVVFSAPSTEVASPDSLVRRLGLRAVARYPDGAVYERAPPAPPLAPAR